MNTRRSIALLLFGVAALAACEKNAVQEISAPLAGEARVKFFNFGVNAPGVNFYAGDRKMTAIGSSSGEESTIGTEYGGVGSGGYYAAIEPGEYELTARIGAETDKDLPISSVTATLSSEMAYSLYQSGFYDPPTKTVDAFIVEDPFPAEIDHAVALVRFVNAISNSNPMTLYVTSTTTDDEIPIGDAVAYTEAGAFTAVPDGVYDLSTRNTGADADVITRTGVSFSAGRVYTIGARGDIMAEPAASEAPFLDNTENR